ncbi:kinetochore nuf2-like protein [Vairimorpha apis BRL 01]|uniref:Kinetochore nuf2-like protein n=1 Tax=Vairimorpha apis BRL 01 TaxID=1037528 RepID=T0MDP6_9MICR|nr:kinetochore nuf2-like protein [Vairimorpha apis BRL 01]
MTLKMHNFVPDLPIKDILEYFNDIGIEIRQSDILKPNNIILLRIYENIVTTFTNIELNYIVDESLYQIILYKKIYNFLTKIGFLNFSIKDLNCESRRFINILSYVVNFSMYRDTKKNVYNKIKQLNDEKNILKEDVEKKIIMKKKEIINLKNNLNSQNKNKENLENEILELDNELKEIIKIQRNLANETELLKSERDEVNDKLNSFQLLIMNTKKEIECLKTQIVSDPTKLVALLKEMKELLHKENESLKNLEKESINLNLKIQFLQKSKEEIKGLINKAVLLKNINSDIEKINNYINNTKTIIKNIESTINASKIRLNYIIRQIGHIETKIYNLQENDKKCSEEIFSKMDKLKVDYKDISTKRSTLQENLDKIIKKCKKLEYEIIKAKNEHECYVNDIVNLLNNIKDNQSLYFSNIKRNLP